MLDRMNRLTSSSYNRVFSSLNSTGAILYGDIEIGVVLGKVSMLNSVSLSSGNPIKSAEKNIREVIYD